MNARLIIALFFVFCFINGSAQSFNTAKLDSLIALVDEHNELMGATAVSKNGKLLYNKAWGHYAIGEKGKLTSNTETKFRIGSISKMFTAVMILQLVEEGKLKLETPLSDFYPSVPNAKDITIEQLLNHHSGLYNFTDSSYFAYHTQPKTKGEMLAIFEKHTPVFNPGTRAEYSNTNFVLLGYILEKVTRKSYAENLKKRITDKIGLKYTQYGSAPDAAKNIAASYNYDGYKWVEEETTDMSIPGGAGAVVSTAKDLVTFVEALFGNKLLQPASLKKMTDIKDGFGLGIFRFPFDEKAAFGHTGGIDEFHSMLGYFPQDGMAFAFTGNGEAIEMNDFAIGLLSIYFNRPYKISDIIQENYHIAEEQLELYEGTYTSEQVPLKITIKREGNRLTAQATGQEAFPLTAHSESLFEFKAARLKMLFDIQDKNQIEQFTLQQAGGSFTFVKEK